MEQNLPIVTRKLWKMMKVAMYMLRKSINKKKILLDLNLFIKRGKFVAGKTLTNLMMFHHHNSVSELNNNGEYEFSFANTPLYRQYFPNNKSTNNHKHQDSIEAVSHMWEAMMVLSSNEGERDFKACNKSPMVRQLRITDSPYPMQSEGGNMHVDEAADEFIKRFYSQLKQQTC